MAAQGYTGTGGTVLTVNDVAPDSDGNVTLTADDLDAASEAYADTAAAGAQAYAVARAHHTGTQPAATVSDFAAAAAAASPVQTVAGRTGTIVLTHADVSGLGGAALLDIGTTASTAAAGDDPRFADSRPPTAHAASHASGGSDPVTLAQTQVIGLATALDGKADLVGGKLDQAQLPDLAIVQYLGSTASQVAMLALTGQQGDFTIRTDLGTVWWITGADPTQLSNWTQAAYPTAPVISVAGRTGAITLAKGDIGLSNVDNTADSAKAFAASQTTSGTFDIARIPVGTDSTHVAAGNDSRLSDQRTPVDASVTTAKLAAGTLAPLQGAPKPLAGRYVYAGGSGATGTVTPNQSDLKYIPFPVDTGFTADTFSVEVTTGAASSSCRLGVFADSGGLPAALINDFSTVATTSTGVKTITPGSAFVFSPKTMYWLGVVSQGGAPSYRCQNSSDPLILPSSTGVSNAAINSYTQSGITGALPNPAVPADAGGAPRVMVHVQSVP